MGPGTNLYEYIYDIKLYISSWTSRPELEEQKSEPQEVEVDVDGIEDQAYEPEGDESKVEIQLRTEKGRHKRLTKKTKWQETSYGPPVQELVTRAKAQGLKRKAAAAAKDQRRVVRAAERKAWHATHASIEDVNNMLDNPDEVSIANSYAVGEEGAPQEELKCVVHPTHRVLKVGQTGAIYCTRCAAYSSRQHLKKLRNPCKGEVLKSSGRNFRLLQLGLLPGLGVRIPPPALRKRKRRW